MKDATFYRALPYTRVVELVEEPGGRVYFLASIVELPGVRGDGADRQEAIATLQEAFEDYLAAMLAWGKPVPEPALWPESLGYDPKAQKQVSARKPAHRTAKPTNTFPEAEASWGSRPEKTEWLDPADLPATVGT